MDPLPMGYSPYAGYLDNEDERKKKLLADADYAQRLDQSRNAGLAFGGVGSLAGAMMPGGPSGGPATNYFAEAMGKTAAPVRPAASPSVGTASPFVGPMPQAPRNVLEDLFKPAPKFEGSSLIPGQVTDEFMSAHPGYNPGRPWASSTDPTERVKQLFIDAQANAPNMGYEPAQQLLRSQLGAFGEGMQSQTQRDIARENNASKVLESELRYSPHALAGQSLLTLMGALGGSGRLDAGSVQRALGVAKEIQNSMGSQLPGFLGGLSLGGTGNPSGSGTPGLDSLSKIDQFMTANSALMPADLQAGGGVDVHGKPVPGLKGGVAKFEQEDAAKLMAALGSAKLGKDEIKGVMDRIMQTPAGSDVRKKLLQQAALDELVNYDPVKNAPRQPGNWLSNITESALPKSRQGGSGQMPGVLGLAGTPFEYSPPSGGLGQKLLGGMGNLAFRHGIPYGQVKLPTGEVIPIDPATEFTSPLNPFTPNKRETEQSRAARSTVLSHLYEALGTPLR